MKQLMALVIICIFFNSVSAQDANSEIPIHYIKPVIQQCSPVEFPAHIDSSLFARYINYNLQPDSIPIAIKPAKGYTIEIRFVVSKEGKISQAKSSTNEKNELTDFISLKFLSFPYQWSPAYRNGRPVNSYHKKKIVF